VADRSTDAEKSPRRALDDAREHSHQCAREYFAQLAVAVERQQERERAALGGRQPLYRPGAVIVRDGQLARLRRRLDDATIQVTAAEQAYVRTCKLAFTRPRR
jgi:hypothetical protein